MIENRKKLYLKQIREFKQKYGQFMVGKSDLFFLMNILGKFVEFMGKKTNVQKYLL